MIGKCPICGEPVHIKIDSEYQGEPPMGGYVDFIAEINAECDCIWTDEQEDEVTDNAKPEEDPNVDRYINDVE